MVWCPYSDAEVDFEATSPEHIVPLSLGGSNQFVIPVKASTNSNVGGLIDGAIANDFLTLVRRNRFDARGHRGKPPKVLVRRASLGIAKRPVQINLYEDNEQFMWDSVGRRYLDEHEFSGQTFSLNVQLNWFAHLRFLAKVVLSAGYFIYGDLFKEYAAHKDVRLLMNADTAESAAKILRNSKLRGYSEFSEIEAGDESDNRLHSYLCESVDGSVVIAVPGDRNIVFIVGILGKMVGELNVPADTTNFPLDREHDLGHVILLSNKTMRQLAFRQFLTEALKKLEGQAV